MFGEYTYCECKFLTFCVRIRILTSAPGIQTFLTLMCTKVSICFFLLRIPTSKAYIRPLKASIAALIISNIILTAIWIFQCSPVQLAWNASLSGNCFGRQFLLNVVLAQAIISIISDFSLALFPIVLLESVRMRGRQKIGLCLLMGLGVITGTCCVVRTALNGQALPIEGTYGGITNWFWRQFEVQLGIACACIPPLLPGYKWLKQKMLRQKSEETTLTSQRAQAEAGAGTMIDLSLENSHLHTRPRRSGEMESDIPREEKGLLKPEMRKRASYQRNEDDEKGGPQHIDGESSRQADGLQTFFRNDTDDQLGSVTAPEPAHTAPNKRAKSKSFSRRDLRSQAPLQPGASSGSDTQGAPRVVVTSVNSSQRSDAARSLGRTRTQESVRATDDPSHPLEFVGLQPGFERNRGLFARILEMNRSSWMSWVSSSSAGKGNDSPDPSAV